VLVGVAVLSLALLSACTSGAEYAAKRREGLLAAYPPGSPTRADVHERLKGRPPTDAFTRPGGGWAAFENQLVASRCLESERRTGNRVESVERYLRADGMFSLCYVWFYYDADERLADTDWQWSSD
jgi:hypothetical protein